MTQQLSNYCQITTYKMSRIGSAHGDFVMKNGNLTQDNFSISLPAKIDNMMAGSTLRIGNDQFKFVTSAQIINIYSNSAAQGFTIAGRCNLFMNGSAYTSNDSFEYSNGKIAIDGMLM